MLGAAELSPTQESRETATLLQLTDRLYRSERLEDVYQAALDAIRELLGCERSSILLFDQDGAMRFVAWRGLSEAYRAAVDGHTPWRPGDRDAEPIFVQNIEGTAEPEWLKRTIKNEGIVALGFVPLMANGEVVGKFMTYLPHIHEFSPHQRDLAVSIARQVGFSLERHRAERARSLAEQQVRESDDRFRQMAEDAPIMIWVADSQGRCLHLNQMLREFWGVNNLESFDWSETMHPEDREQIASGMTAARQSRTGARVKGRYKRHDGQYRVLETTAKPQFGADGRYEGMIGVNVDVTEREEADARKQLMINELNHRVKNTLAVVQSVARQTFKTLPTSRPEVSAFEGRLSALAQAHNLLAATSWQSASLADIARKCVNGDAGARVRVAGPSVYLKPKEAVTTAMALHELYTNALKHGALRTADGTIDITWESDDAADQWLKLRWDEQCQGAVEKPSRRGFGSRMIESAMKAEFHADVQMEFRPRGLLCTIVAHRGAAAV